MSFEFGTMGGFFRLVGGWGHSSGPGIFLLTICSMTKTFLSGTLTAAIFGLAGATSFGVVFGTAALPFAIAASTGFAVGSIGFYYDTLSKALSTLERYPLLLQLHLQSNFPAQRFDRWDRRRLQTQEFRGNWELSSMLVASWLSAKPALDRISQGAEEAMVLSEIEKKA